jgi:hypothetical protein
MTLRGSDSGQEAAWLGCYESIPRMPLETLHTVTIYYNEKGMLSAEWELVILSWTFMTMAP